MDDTGGMIADLLGRILSDRVSERDFVFGGVDLEGARAVDEVGIETMLLSEETGGYGLSAAALLPAIRVLGGYPALLPVVDRVFGRWLAAQAGLSGSSVAVASGAKDLAVVRTGDGWHLSGRLDRVPWFGADAPIAVPFGQDGRPHLALVQAGDAVVTRGFNLAGEPRDTLSLDVVVPANGVGLLPPHLDTAGVRAAGAAVRCQQIAGAARKVLTSTLTYVADRQQFGRPIGRFQAIQHLMATMAGEVVAAEAAADMAADAFGAVDGIAAAAAGKIRCGEAAGRISAIAHQVHGAIGYTEEHRLHRHTKALLAWRDEYGGETSWARLLGERMVAQSQGGLWATLVPVDGELVYA